MLKRWFRGKEEQKIQIQGDDGQIRLLTKHELLMENMGLRNDLISKLIEIDKLNAKIEALEKRDEIKKTSGSKPKKVTKKVKKKPKVTDVILELFESFNIVQELRADDIFVLAKWHKLGKGLPSKEVILGTLYYLVKTGRLRRGTRRGSFCRVG